MATIRLNVCRSFFNIYTRSLRNKCLTYSVAVCLTNRFPLVITYDITKILLSLTETILLDGNELFPVLGSSDWHLWSGQKQEKWDKWLSVNNRTRFVLGLSLSFSHFALIQLWMSYHVTFFPDLFQYSIFQPIPHFIFKCYSNFPLLQLRISHHCL